MAKVLIIGCGDIGAALAEKLVSGAHEVTGVKRTMPKKQLAFNIVQADVSNMDDVEGLDLNVDQLVYILSPSCSDMAAYKDVFEVGVDQVLSALKKQSQDVAITFVSSTRVYGQNKGEWIDERALTEPTDERGQILLAAENKFLAFNDQTTIVRFSGIYGRSSYFLNQLKKGLAVQKKPPYYTNRIHREDCIGVLEFILNKKIKGESLESIYLATDNDPAPKWDVANYVANEFNLERCEQKSVPNDAGQNKRLSNSRLKSSGYTFKASNYKEGYKRLVDG